MEKSKGFFSFLKTLDIFGITIQLFFEGKRKYKSYFGSFISLLIISISCYFFISQLKSWYNIESSTIIYSNENYSVRNLLDSNSSFKYKLDNYNYNLYFAIYAILPDSSRLTYKQLSKYLTIRYIYSKSGFEVDEQQIESENCNTKIQSIFLGLDYETISENQTNIMQMCIKNPLEMGLIADVSTQYVSLPSLSLEIGYCQNSTNHICASMDEIYEFLKYITVQASIPKTIFDFKNQSSPVKRMFKYERYYLDSNLQKTYQNEINPTYIFKDHGIFNDDYQMDSLNFNRGQQIININSIDKQKNILFKYKLDVSFQVEKYYIRNQKLNDIFSGFGGMINILYTIGNIICFYVNSYFYTRSLMKFTFEFGKQSILSSKKKVNSYSFFFFTFSFLLPPPFLFCFCY